MTAKPHAQLQAEYLARQAAKGLKIVKVWGRVENVEKIRAFARKLLGK